MPRTARQLPPGVPYHLTTRGTNKRDIFTDDLDRRRFLDALAVVSDRYSWSCLGYCLMGNHVHLVVHGDPEGVSRGMRDLLGRHSRAFNKRIARTGPLYGSRFHHVPILDDAQITATVRYVALNPVRAGLVDRPEHWEWGSYSALVRDTITPGTLDTKALFSLFARPGATFAQGRKAVRTLVEAGIHDARAAAALERAGANA